MINNDAAVETMIQEKGLTAPRVLPSMIDAMVKSLTFKSVRIEGTTVTVAAAFLPTGFQVGLADSACVDPANFDPAIGERIAMDDARAKARDKLWELEGYVLHKQLTAPALNFKERVIDELEQLTAKVNALAAFRNTDTFRSLDDAEQGRLQHQLGFMMSYAKVLVARINAFEVQHHPV